jgi:hypothetical protein
MMTNKTFKAFKAETHLPLNAALEIAKMVTLKSVKLSIDKIDKIREFEFTISNGKAIAIEIWTNTKRTKGYKSYPVPTQIQDIFKPFMNSF